MQRSVFINESAAQDAAKAFAHVAKCSGFRNVRTTVKPAYGRGFQLLGWYVSYRLDEGHQWDYVMEERE